MPQVLGQRTTNQVVAANEDRLIRQIYDQIGMLEPDEAPLVTLLNLMRRKIAVKSPRYEWFEDDYVARWGQMGTTTVANTTASTVLTVVDGTVFVAGDLAIIPKSPASLWTSPEMIRIVSVSGNALTVIRDVGGAGVDTIPANGYLRLAGSSHEEGGVLPNAKTTAPAKKITYTQIFKKVIDFTGTMIASEVYGAPAGDRRREHAKKLKEFKIDLNSALLFGRVSENLSGGPNSKPIRTTMGLQSVVSTNKTNAGGLLTRKLFESFARSTFRYGSKQKILLASPLLCSALTEWGNSFLTTEVGSNEFGMQVTKVTTGHGTFMVHRDWMLEDPAAGASGFSGLSFGIDLDMLWQVHLSANGENRDTAIHQDVVMDGADRKVDEVRGEIGFVIMQEKFHSMLFNMSDYQA